MNTISVIYSLDKSNNYHIARLLILLKVLQDAYPHGVEGLTKLAKLDFLIRYPTLLQRALTALGRATKLHIEPEEEKSVESAMVRYKYGPWDHKYKALLLAMRARRLIRVEPGVRAVFITLSDAGQAAAVALCAHEAFASIHQRSRIVTNVFGDYKGAKLKDFVYSTFPELRTMRPDKEITPSVH